MSNLPPLPSSMQDAMPAPTSGGVDVSTALTATAQLALKLDGPGFKARDVISKKLAAEREAYAHQLVRDDGFNALWLATFARNIQLDTAPLEAILANTRALDAGEVGELTVSATKMMGRVNKNLPKPPSDKFMHAFRAGTAKADEIIRTAKWLADQIKKALAMYDDMLEPFTTVKVELGRKYDLMFEAVAINQQLAGNEDTRTDTLAQDTALLEYVQIALPERIKELQAQLGTADDKQALQEEIARLTGLQPLVIKAIMTLNPMIFTGNASMDRYLGLSNMAGGRAMVLGLFLSAGIARWESDVVQELQTMSQLAMGLALEEAEQFMNEQGARASEAYVQSAQQYVDLMNRWMMTAETMQTIANDIEAAKTILLQGFKELVGESHKVASAVQDAKTKIDEGQARFNDEMLKVAEGAA